MFRPIFKDSLDHETLEQYEKERVRSGSMSLVMVACGLQRLRLLRTASCRRRSHVAILHPNITNTNTNTSFSEQEKKMSFSKTYSFVKSALSSQNFHYQPLDTAQEEIRILILYGSDLSAPRSGQAELRIVALDRYPEYEALSYQWGTSSADQSIVIDGQHKAITPNLALALHSLRHEMRERVLWVDAICINQRSTKEKSSQVQLMNRIYAEASEVLIWLGRPDASLCGFGFQDAERRAFDTITRLKGNPPRIRNAGTIPAVPVSQRLEYEDLVGIFHLCTRRYWTRIWIIQEVGLARKSTIYCCYDQGPERTAGEEVCSASWESFITAVDQAAWQYNTNSTVLMDPVFRRLIQDISQSLPAQLGRGNGKLRPPLHLELPTLHYLLEISQNSESQRRQDRVFGLLGLSDDCQGKVVADYSKTPHEIYRSVMEYYSTEAKLEKFEDAKLLRLSRILQRNLGLDNPRWWTLLSSNHVFEIPGMVTGTIKGLCPAWDGSSPYFASPGTLFREHVPDPLHGARLHSGLINSIPTNHLKHLLQPVRCSKMSIERPYPTSIYEDSQIPTNVNTTLPNLGGFLHANSTRYFVTDTWNLGLTRVDARAGDMICQFLGCNVAVIIRRRATKYRLIGRALVIRAAGNVPRGGLTDLEIVENGISTFPHPIDFERPDGPMGVLCKMDLQTLRDLSS